MGSLWVVVPASYSCAVQMNSVTYPSSANTKQSFQIVAEVTATCTSQLTEIASVRVDVVDAASTIAIASGLFMPGYAFTAMGGGSAHGSVVNTVSAPLIAGEWDLRVEALFFWGSILMSSAKRVITIQVGSPPSQATSSAASNSTTTTKQTTLNPTATVTETKTVGLELAMPTREQGYQMLAVTLALAFVVVLYLLLRTRKKLGPHANS